MFTIVFWKAVAERAIGTFSASFVGLAVLANPLDYMTLPWGKIFVASLVITGLTLLKTLGAGYANGSPGFGTAEHLTADKPLEQETTGR